MRIDRLLGITLLLLNRGSATAGELAERFEVSTRTIYRDIDDLSAAGVPVFCSKGHKGGISIMENYVLNRSLLNEQERDSLLLTLQTLRITRYPEIETVLDKIGALFKNSAAAEWVQIEFSPWGSGPNEENKFRDLKRAVLERRVTVFDYLNAGNVASRREAEPLNLLFKSQAWYIRAFCRSRRDFRIFRLSRMRNLRVTDERFADRPASMEDGDPAGAYSLEPPVELKLRFGREELYRVYDDYDEEKIRRNPDGSCEVSVNVPAGEWVFGYILSFGSQVEVLAPDRIRREIQQRLEKALEYYRKADKYDNQLSDKAVKMGADQIKEANRMDVKYVVKGEPGKTCADCGLYKDKGNGLGDCNGYEVLAAGSCNIFVPKGKGE